MRRFLIGFAILAGLTALIRHFPLSWAGAALPAEVGTLSGTIWDGQVDDVPLLGTVSVKAGFGNLSFLTAPGDVTLSGKVSPTGIENLILSMPVAKLPMNDARLSGLSGRVSLRIKEAVIKDGACMSATGTGSTDVLAANRARFDWAGPEFSGPVDCADGRLRVQLRGEAGAETVLATVMTGLDGVYQSDVTVSTADPAAGNVLTLFGFNPAGDGDYRLSEQGRWR
ncbi:MAG: type II secretion system protein N [Litorimonas sp.]